jgi:hypothetical protein
MPFAAAAAVVSAGVGIYGSMAAADAQSSAISKGAAQARGDLAPFKDTGVSATTRQGDLLGLNGQEAADSAIGGFQKSPGYDFQFNEGLRAIDAGAASTGMLRSGATIKAEQAFGTGLADKEFGDYVRRKSPVMRSGELPTRFRDCLGTKARKTRSPVISNRPVAAFTRARRRELRSLAVRKDRHGPALLAFKEHI